MSALRVRLAHFIRRFPKLILIPYYLYRFIQPKYSVGVVGIVFNAEGEVLLVEHVFHPRLPWGLPGGWIGRNEDPAIAVQRELQEELHLDVSAEHVILTQRTQYNHLDIAYLCTTSQTDIDYTSYELIGHDWINVESLPPLHKFHYDVIRLAHQQLMERML